MSIQIRLNGEPHTLSTGLTAADLVEQLGLSGRRIAVEINEEIVPAANTPTPAWSMVTKWKWFTRLAAAKGNTMTQQTHVALADTLLTIAGRDFHSRLLVGTGKYKDFTETGAAIAQSGAEIVTFAVRRTNLGQDADAPNLLDVISPNAAAQYRRLLQR